MAAKCLKTIGVTRLKTTSNLASFGDRASHKDFLQSDLLLEIYIAEIIL